MSVPQPGGLGAKLPDWHELLAAFCGHVGAEPDAHPVTRWGRELAELHLARREFPLRTAEIDCRRAELVVQIDNWVGAHMSTPRPYPRSLGASVDGMAAAQVRAGWLLRGADSSDERVHAAWFQLAALADDWTDLIARTDTSARPLGAPVRERRRRAAGQ
ncbi:DUF4254 domain-containing protein [Nocardia alni]|uniref:DUF4254 domain-containing protein n=1 Tax=Nocardia alni TaxID=2815723 RepID=UPI001C212AC6|nr:DUF4254 domain-containing protein [Nocardia alni]